MRDNFSCNEKSSNAVIVVVKLVLAESERRNFARQRGCKRHRV